GRGDRRLVDEAEEAAVVATRLRRGPLRRRDDVGDEIEGEAAIRAERDRDLVLDLVEVGHEQVAVLVEGKAGVAPPVANVVVIADYAGLPRRAAVEADGQKHPGGQSGFAMTDVREDDDVPRVGRIDGDRLFGFIQVAPANIDVQWRLRGRGRCAGAGDAGDAGGHSGTGNECDDN